ncbi:uncharacterized protein FOMMEDRAFT_155971 [Fomitiporia mediterranea MF3/22]|uniref:uncharacterized protein n=1 Tax=Fomitiporia mediterranea (strain MF3/22) TaxID=694068 RepID=UPI0004409B1A|nr:uncharacterized protein FOMMEDRAFT_155971 [Fomitiporia mediterranea MF3/22]EJD02646.1 hypothetical protein FOMMEDRAFT_155971 [Fomitiporia mediterranea MF3/22]
MRQPVRPSTTGSRVVRVMSPEKVRVRGSCAVHGLNQGLRLSRPCLRLLFSVFCWKLVPSLCRHALQQMQMARNQRDFKMSNPRSDPRAHRDPNSRQRCTLRLAFAPFYPVITVSVSTAARPAGTSPTTSAAQTRYWLMAKKGRRIFDSVARGLSEAACTALSTQKSPCNCPFNTLLCESIILRPPSFFPARVAPSARELIHELNYMASRIPIRHRRARHSCRLEACCFAGLSSAIAVIVGLQVSLMHQLASHHEAALHVETAGIDRVQCRSTNPIVVSAPWHCITFFSANELSQLD